MRRAVVIANATIDETYAVAALPRPGESLIGELRTRDVGGKGANVATVLARAGVPTTLVAALGDDERGAFVRERLAAEPLTTSLATARGIATDLSIVCSTPDGDNAIVTTVAASRALDLAHAIASLDGTTAGDLLVLQGNLAADVTLGLIGAAANRRLLVALNPSPFAPWLVDAIGRVDVVFANEGEAEALSGARGEAAVRALIARGPGRVVVTRGAEASLLGARTVPSNGRSEGRGNGRSDGPDGGPGEGPSSGPSDGGGRRPGGERGDGRCDEPGDRLSDRPSDGSDDIRIVAVPAAPADVVDTTGAGDTFMGTALASSVRRGTRLDAEALAHAARAAAITVARRGTGRAFPSARELEDLLAPSRHRDRPPAFNPDRPA